MRAAFLSLVVVAATSGCSLSEGLRHLEPIDEKMGQIRDRLARLDAVEAQLGAMNRSLVGLDGRLAGLERLDSGIGATRKSVDALSPLLPAIEKVELRLGGLARIDSGVAALHAMVPGLARVEGGLGAVARNDELVKVGARLDAQLAALAETKTQLREMNEKLGGLSALAQDVGGEAKVVLGWRTAVVAGAVLFLCLNAFLHLRLLSVLGSPGLWRRHPSGQE